jgi:hypothetical protein
MQVIVVAAILALAGAVDFVQRIHVPRSLAIRGAGMEATALPDLPLSLASARQRLQSWLPTQTSGPQAASIDVANESRESAVRIPDRADLGGWRFVLRGVFDAGPPFAVFDVMSSTGGEFEQHRVSAGDVIKGVRVERISGRSVSLSDGEKVIQLALFIDPSDDIVPTNEKDE